MPWVPADVDSHMKGLSDAQKQTWCDIANAALTKCETGEGKDCDASAIMQANAVMSKNMAQTQTFNIAGIEIFSVGKWNGDTYTEGDLDEMVSAFTTVGFEPPLKLGHNEDQMKDGHPALGWVKTIYRNGQKLLADFTDIPQKLYEALQRGNYKRVSSEIYWNYAVNGKSFPKVLKAVALLGADIPAVTNLESIQGLYKEGTNEYRVYEGSNKENKEDIKMEKEMQELKDQLAKLSEAQGVAEAEKAALAAKVAELEGTNKEAQTKLAEREAEVKAAQIKEFVGKYKKTGQVLPAFEAEIIALLTSAVDAKTYSYSHEGKTVELSQRATIERLVGLLPKTIVFGELGGGSGADAEYKNSNYDNAGVEVDRRAKLLMKKGGVKVYEEAVKAVLTDDPELKTDYLGGK